MFKSEENNPPINEKILILTFYTFFLLIDNSYINIIYNSSLSIQLLNSDDNVCSYNTINNNFITILLDLSDKNIILINSMNYNVEGVNASYLLAVVNPVIIEITLRN